MIRMIQSRSSTNAKKYFDEALAQTEYLVDRQEICGRFQGEVSARLQTGETVSKELFHKLCDNINPVSGDILTLRNKGYRTIGYDINFHCPKSVSILNVFSKDKHIQEAFQDSVAATMLKIEMDAQTRVRRNNHDENRKTGSLIWADFIHLTSRPVKNNNPDPHLHCHCFTFNVTWDDVEQRFKAAQFGDIKRDMPFYQAQFYKTLSDNLLNLGYQLTTNRNSFEINGVPARVISLFSKRTLEISAIAKAEKIADQKKLDGLGARTRANKQKGFSMHTLKQEWKKQILGLAGDDDDKMDDPIRSFSRKPLVSQLTAQQCIDYAIAHCFERASVMQERRILAAAYSYSIGHGHISIEAIDQCFNADERILKVKDGSKLLCTTQEVIDEEKRMVELAVSGNGRLLPLYATCPKLSLSGHQEQAVRHVLTTTHQVSIVQGQAGTGKTTLMQEAVRHIQATGKMVTVVAPTAQASRGVLRAEGFDKADTVAALLCTPALQQQLGDGVLWVDEAGLLGTKDMVSLLELATSHNAQLILSGDTRQHASVVRGDALRILNTVAGIRAAEVSRIYRQKTEQYRLAVQALAQDNIQEGFERLHSMGAINVVNADSPYQLIVDDYVCAIKKKRSALVVCPTHYQGEMLTVEIRKRLRTEKKIDNTDHACLRLVNVNMTQAEKTETRNYQTDNIIQFSQNVKGIKRGSIWRVSSIRNDRIDIIGKHEAIVSLPLGKCDAYEIFRETEINLAKGDSIRINKNGFDTDKKRLNNGQSLKVVSIEKEGSIQCKNIISKVAYRLPSDFGHISHDYCVTSHASQGKTVDEVFIFQPSDTFTATNAKQIYVSVSRAKYNVQIYTDDLEGLFAHASGTGNRTAALELVQNGGQTDAGEQIVRLEASQPSESQSIKSPDQNINVTTRRINGITPTI